MKARLEKLRSQFNTLGIDAFLVTHLPHLRYISGFSGSSGIGLVTKTAAILVTDSRYTLQARQQAKSWRILIANDSPVGEFQRRRVFRKGWKIAIDGNTLPYTRYTELKKTFPHVDVVSRVGTIEKITTVKEPSEIQTMKRAIAITDKVFGEILDVLRPGMTELEVAAEISYRQRKYGAEADAFETIVASGQRGALPHGRASAKRIRKGEFVTLDFGCIYGGYYSDLTRTVAIGKPSREWRKIYQTVLDAQRRAIDTAASGVLAKDLDALARAHIKKMGYEKYFTHSLGHGLGMQIHELPRISSRSVSRLQSGNVITIEPGIYIPKSGGVRIEDDVLITNGSNEVLTHSTKELLVL